MSINAGFKEAAMASALAATALTGGCGPMLPKIRNVNEISPTHCVITKANSFRRGAILSIILPFIPDHSHSDTTKVDENCMDRSVAQAIFQKSDIQSRTIGTAIYDQLSPAEKLIMNAQFKAQGTSIEQIAEGLPRIIETTRTDNCVKIRFQLPGESQQRPYILKCATVGHSPS